MYTECGNLIEHYYGTESFGNRRNCVKRLEYFEACLRV